MRATQYGMSSTVHVEATLTDCHRRMLGSIPRAPSPTADADDSVDGIELDPELAMIARSAKIEAQRQMSTPAIDSRSSSPVRVGGPENVTIKVRWKSHPLDPSPRNVVYEYLMRRVSNWQEYAVKPVF